MLVLFIAVILLFVAVCILSWRIKNLSDRIVTFEQNLVTPLPKSVGPYIKLQLVDPQGVAQRESKLAKAVGAVSPGYINYKVYQQVAYELELALNERNIDVNIELHGLRSSNTNANTGANASS